MGGMVRTRLRLAQLNAERVAPDGPAVGLPLVLVHGLGGGIWGWENFQVWLAEHGRTSIALELPFHGSSRDQAVGDYSVETYALFVAAAVAPLAPCFVLGHSMGGLIAQKLCESMPQAGYIFLASAPPWHMFRRAYLRMWGYALRHPIRDIVDGLLHRPMALDHAMSDALIYNRLTAEERRRVYELDTPDSGRATKEMAFGQVRVDERQFSSPCLVVGCLADGLIPASEQQAMASRFGCELRLYDRGHMLQIEAGWEEVVAGLASWMEGIEATRNDAAGRALQLERMGAE